jgi:mannosylglycerate hydrolase
LIKTLDKLLNILQNDPEFKHFLLDGQVIPFEDYIEIRPEKKELFLKYIKEGRIIIGPWYTQPDEWLSFPESLVRNLLFGEKFAKELGVKVMKVGYTPDSFGHTAQLPQILNGFDIDSFIFMRGMGDEGEELGTEFLWKAPNGSKVISSYLEARYDSGVLLGLFVNNPAYFYLQVYPATTIVWKSGFFPFTQFYGIYQEEPKTDVGKAVQHVKALMSKLTSRVKSSCLLIMNGADHIPPQESLSIIIKGLRNHFKDLEIEHGTLEHYIESVRSLINELQSYEGEFRSARYNLVVPNVISTRIPQIKIPSFYAQTAITYYLEPLLTACWILGDEYPSNILNYIWKLILQSLPHDSICACSVDDAQKDVETRLRQANEIIRNLILEKLISLANKVNTKELGDGDFYILAFNPLNWKRTDKLELYAEVPPAKYIACDENGQIPIIIEEIKTFPHFKAKQIVKLVLLAKDVPPLGYKTFKVKRVGEEYDKPLFLQTNKIENDYYIVKADERNGGSLTIVDKRNGMVYKEMNLLVDEGDAGDEYNFSPPYKQRTYTSKGISAQVYAEKTPIYSCLKIKYSFKVPKGLDGQRRSEELVEIPVSMSVYLYSNIARIDVSLSLENKAKDHRLRLCFNTGIKSNYSYADTHYYVIERSTKPSLGKNWVETPIPDYHMLRWISVSDGSKGMALATHGLHEYQLNPNGTLYVTVLRCIGYLSRSNLLTRTRAAAPLIPTPEAQCLGKYTFYYSIIPHERKWKESNVYKDALNFCIPLLGIATNMHEGMANIMSSLLSLKPDSMHITTIKKGEYDESIIVRFYNQSGEEERVKLRLDLLNRWVKKVKKVKLSEELIETLMKGGEEKEITIRPWEVITLKLTKE